MVTISKRELKIFNVISPSDGGNSEVNSNLESISRKWTINLRITTVENRNRDFEVFSMEFSLEHCL